MEEELIKKFLNETGQWKEIEKSFIDYKKNIDKNGSHFINASIVPSFRYSYPNLASFSEDLLDFIINNPQKYDRMVRNVVLEAVNKWLEQISKPFTVEIEQIYCIHRFEGLPRTKEYTFYPTNKSLSNLTCVLAARGEEKMYMRHAVRNCELKRLPNEEEDDVTRCEPPWKEYVALRDMSKHVELSVFQLEGLQTPKCMGKMYDKFDVILRDDLTKINTSFGPTYVITGIYDGIKKAFYAWNIVEKEDI